MANTIDTIVQIGKAGLTENTVSQASDALAARELIKLRVLEGSPLSAREAADALAPKLGADVVQVIGTRFVLYKPKPKDPVIRL